MDSTFLKPFETFSAAEEASEFDSACEPDSSSECDNSEASSADNRLMCFLLVLSSKLDSSYFVSKVSYSSIVIVGSFEILESELNKSGVSFGTNNSGSEFLPEDNSDYEDHFPFSRKDFFFLRLIILVGD